MITTETKYDMLTTLIDDITGIYLPDYMQDDELDYEGINNAYDLEQFLEEKGAFNIDIIYYSKAMEYLAENDNSLKESLEIASEYGFELENINSETLASLHASQKARNDFWEIEKDINNILSK
jgi:hypothetical protein